MLKKHSGFKKALPILLLISLVSFLISCDTTKDNFSFTVFKNVNIIPMNQETVLGNYNVVIKDGKIIKIGKAWITRVPKNAIVIEGKGKYLMPGLNDMHVHLWYKDELILYLANGVTTIRDMFGDSDKLSLRKKIKQGEILGPNLYVSSPIIDGDPPIHRGSTVISNPEDADNLITEYKEMGYDFIKVYERLTTDVYDSIIRVARKEDIPVVGHVPSLVGIEKTIQSGQKSIEHLDKYNSYNEKLYNLTIVNNVWNCPTIVVNENQNRALAEEKLDGIEYVYPATVSLWKRRLASYTKQAMVKKRITNMLHDKGGKILLGTDANNPFIIPGFSVHDELYNLVDAGLTPYEAIRTGTYNAAEFLNVLDETGTVEVGKYADLVLLDGNPLDDITNMKRIEGVMIRGKWISKIEIDNMLKTISEKY